MNREWQCFKCTTINAYEFLRDPAFWIAHHYIQVAKEENQDQC